jgi:DNA-damage-inducible protein J
MVTKIKNNDEVKAKMESGLKHDVEEILSEIGINHSEAIRIFYKQILIHRGIPFELKLRIPNKETIKAMKDAKSGIDLIECADAEDVLRKLKE